MLVISYAIIGARLRPFIEPDMKISRIRISDKTSRLHPRWLAATHIAWLPDVVPQ
jgi:hypothetical protein